MLKKTLVLFAGLCVSLAVFAATSELRPGHPDTYVVKRGDTLWDISARFLRKPWLWPEIWQANPQVHNPHLIYPGDVLNLSYDHGPRLVLKPRARATDADAVPAIALDQVRPFLKDFRVVSSHQLSTAPYVMAFEENKLRGTPGHFIYVRGLTSQPGQRWAVVRPSHVFREFGVHGERGDDVVAHELNSNVGMVDSPWRENDYGDGHYGRGDELGVEVKVIGTAEMLRGGDPSTLMLTDSTMEIRKGDRLLPVDEHPYDAYFYPHAPKVMPPNARVISLADSMYAVGRHQVVAISVGTADGISNGETFSIFSPGQTVHDDVAGSYMNQTFGNHVKLPGEYLGHLMVFRTFDRVSYALVMDDVRPVQVGDKLRLPQ
ncbi:LysM peptidoglycan-binding domain-containing protein [Oleiagrimonas sp. C23AA]|uniref:LysM peptidoglycan-binding domain-containing protein n=1 Tax=Oleiagrimonas sp. C23AA TaxID=2719047 RepID=UPI00141FD814|nr:LysM peptidoglycan-binding domain-containing protein [Oleiagrimonas sp. C23AA]NII10832.1 LysM peptidoglycan-binding domain-containing protein [Oleiagrimonas sp. C23AA]